MKKEWIYFIAGAGLMALILVVLDANYYSSRHECELREKERLHFPTLGSPAEEAIYEYCYNEYSG